MDLPRADSATSGRFIGSAEPSLNIGLIYASLVRGRSCRAAPELDGRAQRLQQIERQGDACEHEHRHQHDHRVAADQDDRMELLQAGFAAGRPRG